jgi:hypothetical protein
VIAVPDNERGSVVAFVVLLVTCLMALAGLVSEGGAVLSAREAAMAEAEQAARLGAATVSPLALHKGEILDPGTAPVSAAEAYMKHAGHKGTVVISGSVVTATITPFRVNTPLLALAGIFSMKVSAKAKAEVLAR